MMAPFVDKSELLDLFSGKNLLQAEDMEETYKQLLGLSKNKPFECVGTYSEVNQAYRLAIEIDDSYRNSVFEPSLNIYKETLGPHQKLFDQFLDYHKLI